jgi:hypothetical protein
MEVQRVQSGYQQHVLLLTLHAGNIPPSTQEKNHLQGQKNECKILPKNFSGTLIKEKDVTQLLAGISVSRREGRITDCGE